MESKRRGGVFREFCHNRRTEKRRKYKVNLCLSERVILLRGKVVGTGRVGPKLLVRMGLPIRAIRVRLMEDLWRMPYVVSCN